jgi:hypothetical protein
MNCSNPCLECPVNSICQPFGNEFTAADGIWIKEMRIPHANTLVPQHSHEYDHTSYLAAGSVLFEGEIYDAPHPFYIPAHKMHTDNTLILCIHNISRSGAVQIHAENRTLEV